MGDKTRWSAAGSSLAFLCSPKVWDGPCVSSHNPIFLFVQPLGPVILLRSKQTWTRPAYSHGLFATEAGRPQQCSFRQHTQTDRKSNQTEKHAAKAQGNLHKCISSSIFPRIPLHSRLCCTAGFCFHRGLRPWRRGETCSLTAAYQQGATETLKTPQRYQPIRTQGRAHTSTPFEAAS